MAVLYYWVTYVVVFRCGLRITARAARNYSNLYAYSVLQLLMAVTRTESYSYCKYKSANDNQPMMCRNTPAFRLDEFRSNILFSIYHGAIFYNEKAMKNYLAKVHEDYHYFCEYCTDHYSQFHEQQSRVTSSKWSSNSEAGIATWGPTNVKFAVPRLCLLVFKKHMKSIRNEERKIIAASPPRPCTCEQRYSCNTDQRQDRWIDDYSELIHRKPKRTQSSNDRGEYYRIRARRACLL